ncbi:uncharacterized protein LOC133918098 [Phragmites australis]|uniref:uncharacterized protein LOC133918098 n=1 Tax=Phragmites australis TaxID=29695 RepID=UPI002D79F447|nr:uncharacterized protein LOC133918098 [Phragmites australis]
MAQPPDLYPMKGITEAISILEEINAHFASNPVVGEEFFALVTDANGAIDDGRAVVARAKKLLRGNSKLFARFQGFLDPGHQIELPNNDVSIPRPRRRRDNSHPAVGASGRADPRAGRNGRDGIDTVKHVDEEIYDGSLDEAKDKQFLEGAKHADEDIYDELLVKAKQFLERAKHLDMEMYNGLLAEILHVGTERGLNAHQVYRRFKQLLGSAHGDLLCDFVGFLPSKYDPQPRCAKEELEDQPPTPKRKHASYAGVDAAESSRPSRDKKPRVDDSTTAKRNPSSYADAGAAGSSRPSGGKKHCADDEEEVQRFREAWEFETGYSKLVATMTRAELLQRESTHGASGSGGQGRASVEELFPSGETQEYLAKMYHDEWDHLRKVLEDADYVSFALKIILDRLREKEAAAVEEARSRRDPTRAAEKLDELVQDKVREERERRGV